MDGACCWAVPSSGAWTSPTLFAGIPEIFLAYDLQATTWHSAADGANAAVHNQGEHTDYQHKARMFFPPQHGFQE